MPNRWSHLRQKEEFNPSPEGLLIGLNGAEQSHYIHAAAGDTASFTGGWTLNNSMDHPSRGILSRDGFACPTALPGLHSSLCTWLHQNRLCLLLERAARKGHGDRPQAHLACMRRSWGELPSRKPVSEIPSAIERKSLNQTHSPSECKWA